MKQSTTRVVISAAGVEWTHTQKLYDEFQQKRFLTEKMLKERITKKTSREPFVPRENVLIPCASAN